MHLLACDLQCASPIPAYALTLGRLTDLPIQDLKHLWARTHLPVNLFPQTLLLSITPVKPHSLKTKSGKKLVAMNDKL